MTSKGEEYKSIIDPPSHILADGRHVFLPPPSVQEKASFFARCVAKHGLIHADTKIAKKSKDDDEEEEDSSGGEAQGRDKSKKNKDDDLGVIHPLAVASARLECNGISELSKAINLTTLIQSGEYFALSNIVESSMSESNVVNGNKPEMNINIVNTAKDPSGRGEIDMDANEANLRSKFILKRKRQQYNAATDALKQQYKRLKVITSTQRVVDDRLMQLRRRWRLAAPEHGTVAHPVRPSETVAIDVDIYRRGHSSSGVGTTLGKIARKVPRYATIELSEDFDVKSLPTRRIDQDRTIMESDVIMTEGDASDHSKNGSNPQPASSSQANNNHIHTVASPFAVADPTNGTDSEIFDPENVPMLTLYFQIEKSSTGFIHSVALSSSIKLNTNEETKKAEISDVIASIVDDKVKLNDDEKAIQMLQHSLFCANIFDAIRKEIVHSGHTLQTIASNGRSSGGVKGRQNISMQQQQQPVWLSSEMEENFFPPPSLMAGDGHLDKSRQTDGTFNTAPLSVVHCHEGEVKVQLDSEYALAVKLVNVKHGSVSNEGDDNSMNGENNDSSTITSRSDSGSQSREQLHILCRMLLLHAQFVFHDHNKRKALKEQENKETEVNSKSVDYSVNREPAGGPLSGGRNAMSQKNQIERIPMILQSCVVLGSKVLFERKVRDVLENLSKWQKEKKPSMNFSVEWLPLSMFDSHSQIAISLGDAHSIDLNISGSKMTVTSFTNEGDYRVVSFESCEEFELHMRMEMENLK